MNDSNRTPADYVAGILNLPSLNPVLADIINRDLTFAIRDVITITPVVEPRERPTLDFGTMPSIDDMILSMHDEGKTAIETRKALIGDGIRSLSTRDIERVVQRAGRRLICRRAARVTPAVVEEWKHSINVKRCTYDQLELDYGHKANTIREYVTGRRSISNQQVGVGR